MASKTCIRCGRALKDPKSIERGMGPVCWAASSGSVFESDLEASEEEWERREKLLKSGGEIDFGVNWKHIDYDPEKMIQLPLTMRISVRYREGAFEAYGSIADPRGKREIVFCRSNDIKKVYKEAVLAGPQSEAMAHRIMKEKKKQFRQMKMAI